MNLRYVIAAAWGLLGGGYLLVCVIALVRNLREVRAVERDIARERHAAQNQAGIQIQASAPCRIDNNRITNTRVRSWSDPAVKGFLRGDR